MNERKHKDYIFNDGGSMYNNPGAMGGVVLKYGEELDGTLPKGVCRLCGGYDIYKDGVTRVRFQDGFGEVRYYRCHRCDGSGKEPPTRIWDGVWWKPWTWRHHHFEVL